MQSWRNEVFKIVILGVKQAYQGNGIGTKLLEFFKKKYEDIVLVSNSQHVDFYKKRGFKENSTVFKLVGKEVTPLFPGYEFLCYGFKDLKTKNQRRKKVS